MKTRGVAHPALKREAPRTTTLIGREREIEALFGSIDAAKDGNGGALLMRGAPGVGKTTLVSAARGHAAARGFRVLSTVGIESESHLPFAGLHQLLRPILSSVDRLPDAYGRAIQTALGLSEDSPPSPFQIAGAILHLLGECAESGTIVILVDDAHWLDRSSADALAFVSRRLESDPIAMLLVIRDGFDSPLLSAQLQELRVEVLADSDAATLLDTCAPRMAAGQRARILADGAGNPLALVELAAMGDAAPATQPGSPATSPLTDRLERAFADRLSSLSLEARSFLHVAATDESSALDELVRATSILLECEITLRPAEEAQRAGLVTFDGHHLLFRHPLMRSAIHQAMALKERLAAHAAWAAVLAGDPDRRAWHRAAAAVGPDERIAADLEEAAHRANARGAQAVALAAFERAAELAKDPARRGSRLLDAATLAMVLGRPRDCARLLRAIHDDELQPDDRLQAEWLRELYMEGAWSGASRVASFVKIADRMRAGGDVERGVQALRYIALRCWWSNPGAETCAAFCAVVRRFPDFERNARLLYCLAMADPVGHGVYVMERVSRGWNEREEHLGNDVHNFGMAAQAVGDFLHAERFLEIEIERRRSLGWLGQLGLSLVSQSWTKIQRGDWKQAGSMANEAARLTEETQQPLWTAAAHLASATIAAYRGDIPLAQKLAAESERELLPRGAGPMLALVQYPRGAAAIAAGQHDEGYQHLRRIFDAADSAYHPHLRSWALVDLAEAAVQSGHEDEATRFVRDLETIAAQSRSPLLLAALSFAHQVLSPDDAGFGASPAAIVDFPFILARLQLARGLWLRRQRRPADARTPLRAARDAFDALGAVPWGERARQELRASGEAGRRRGYDLLDALSPQEFQIAQLAAAGLSNKEIALQLFLSHRTVSSHLYKVFPKLGITARSHLSAALSARFASSS